MTRLTLVTFVVNRFLVPSTSGVYGHSHLNLTKPKGHGLKVEQGHLGAKTSKGTYDYGGRSEVEILKKRDRLYLKTLDHLERIKAFEPV